MSMTGPIPSATRVSAWSQVDLAGCMVLGSPVAEGDALIPRRALGHGWTRGDWQGKSSRRFVSGGR